MADRSGVKRNPRAISRIIVPFRKAGFSSVCTGDAVQSTRNYGTHNLRLLCCKPTSNHGCLAIQTHSTRVRNLHVNSVLRQRPEYENNISVTGSRSGNIEVQHDRMLLRYGEFDMELLYMWLRDHCRCEVCYNHSTYQKNVDNYKINPGERPVKVEFDGLLLTITWPDQHITTYDINWLVDNTYHTGHTDRKAKVAWDKRTMEEAGLPTVNFRNYMETEDGVRKHLSNLVKFGFSIVTESPPVHHTGTVEVASRLTFLQNTHFGQDWIFTSNKERGDTAFTDMYLGAHTDNTYFTAPSGIQVFHVLEHDGEGGQTLLVDGYFCAEQLRSKHPHHFDLLSHAVIPHEYYEKELRMRSLGKVLSVHPTSGKFLHIRYNPYDRSPLYTLPPDLQKEFYIAYENLGTEIRNPDNEFWVKLRPGMVLFIDNWRVLHGRAAFTGRRWVSGCYLPRDDWTSRARLMGLMNL